MANATVTKDEIVGLIKGLEDKVDKSLTPIQSLLKAAQEPASRAGVSPEEYLSGQFKDGMALFDVGGHGGHSRRKSHGPSRRKTHIGRGVRSDNSPDNSFGHWMKAFHDMHDTDHVVGDAHQKAVAVCKSFGTKSWDYHTVAGVDMVRKSDMLESQATLGGYLAPEQFEKGLYEVEIESSIIDQYAQQHAMVARTKVLPGLDQVNETFTATAGQSNLLGGIKFFWAAEGATRQQTNPRFRNVVLTANELSFYCGATNTLLQDVDGLDAMLTKLFGEAAAWGVDWSCFRGNGVGQPLGLQNAGCAINVSRQTSSEITIQDLENMYQYVYFPTRNPADLVWVAHPSCIPWILRLNDQSGYTAGTGRRLFIPIDQGAQAAIKESDGPRGFGEIWGSKLLLSEKVPPLGTTGDLGLYNMDTYAQGRRMDIEIMVSPHVQFLQNSSVWRVVLRMDGQPLLGKKITYADAGTYASPVVLLQ